MKKRPVAAIIVAAVMTAAPLGKSTTIDPMSIEEQIIRADLIALLKVTTCGGFYSKCKVLDSVKGSHAARRYPHAGAEEEVRLRHRHRQARRSLQEAPRPARAAPET